jgi:zinc finger HIT domain-containing protein 3
VSAYFSYSCSVACNRIHQDNHPEILDLKPAVSPPQTDSTALQKAREPLDPYKVLLDHTSDFKNLFTRYPTLEKRLCSIYEQTLRPTDDGDSGYRNGLPWKLGKGGQPPHKDEPWTFEKGLRKGAAALRLARMDPSEGGDGVREYCELVLYVLGKQDNRDVTNIVRSEIVQEETRVIERLLREDEP